MEKEKNYENYPNKQLLDYLKYLGGNRDFVFSIVQKDEYQGEEEKQNLIKYIKFLKKIGENIELNPLEKTITLSLNGVKKTYKYSKDKNGKEIFVCENFHFGKNQFDKYGITFEFLENILKNKGNFDYRF